MVNATQVNPVVQIVPTRGNETATQVKQEQPVQQNNSTLVEGDQYQTYTVKKGDTLWDISARKLGNPTQWPSIFQLNQNQIENPNLIYPQQILRLPIALHDPVQVQPKPDEVIVPHEPVQVQPKPDEVIVPHEPVQVQPKPDEVIVPHKPVQVQPKPDEVIIPTRPGQTQPQQPVQEQPINQNPSYPNIVPVKGNEPIAPQPGGQPPFINPVKGQPGQPSMPIEQKSGLHRAAGIGGLIGSGLAGGLIYRATSKVPASIATHFAPAIDLVTNNAVRSVMSPAAATKTLGFINKIGGPKVAAGVAIVGAGIIGAGIAAGIYKLSK